MTIACVGQYCALLSAIMVSNRTYAASAGRYLEIRGSLSIKRMNNECDRKSYSLSTRLIL